MDHKKADFKGKDQNSLMAVRNCPDLDKQKINALKLYELLA
ncbi:hypothetical protein [Legionella quinlivanii]|nr:hypothetical protein [Legionella quinlivanii]